MSSNRGRSSKRTGHQSVSSTTSTKPKRLDFLDVQVEIASTPPNLINYQNLELFSHASISMSPPILENQSVFKTGRPSPKNKSKSTNRFSEEPPLLEMFNEAGRDSPPFLQRETPMSDADANVSALSKVNLNQTNDNLQSSDNNWNYPVLSSLHKRNSHVLTSSRINLPKRCSPRINQASTSTKLKNEIPKQTHSPAIKTKNNVRLSISVLSDEFNPDIPTVSTINLRCVPVNVPKQFRNNVVTNLTVLNKLNQHSKPSKPTPRIVSKRKRVNSNSFTWEVPPSKHHLKFDETFQPVHDDRRSEKQQKGVVCFIPECRLNYTEPDRDELVIDAPSAKNFDNEDVTEYVTHALIKFKSDISDILEHLCSHGFDTKATMETIDLPDSIVRQRMEDNQNGPGLWTLRELLNLEKYCNSKWYQKNFKMIANRKITTKTRASIVHAYHLLKLRKCNFAKTKHIALCKVAISSPRFSVGYPTVPTSECSNCTFNAGTQQVLPLCALCELYFRRYACQRPNARVTPTIFDVANLEHPKCNYQTGTYPFEHQDLVQANSERKFTSDGATINVTKTSSLVSINDSKIFSQNKDTVGTVPNKAFKKWASFNEGSKHPKLRTRRWSTDDPVLKKINNCCETRLNYPTFDTFIKFGLIDNRLQTKKNLYTNFGSSNDEKKTKKYLQSSDVYARLGIIIHEVTMLRATVARKYGFGIIAESPSVAEDYLQSYTENVNIPLTNQPTTTNMK